jgi:hypothetical protein
LRATDVFLGGNETPPAIFRDAVQQQLEASGDGHEDRELPPRETHCRVLVVTTLIVQRRISFEPGQQQYPWNGLSGRQRRTAATDG